MAEVIFLKLGGSLITDKTAFESVRDETLPRLADEIAGALMASPSMRLILGHGSGSFGHVAAAKHDTRHGVRNVIAWQGFARVSDAAARLNRMVVEVLLAAGVSAITMQPSASAICDDGRIQAIAVEPVKNALEAGLVPVLYGDVAFDLVRGGTIISTEEVLMALAGALQPSWFLLAGETAGVLDESGRPIPLISAANYDRIASFIGGSRGTDVTGGMDSKVRWMLDLVQAYANLQVRIFSGLEPAVLQMVLAQPQQPIGTKIQA